MSKKTKKRLLIEAGDVIDALLEWIDAVPPTTTLPTMPGVDRDWVEDVRYQIRTVKEEQNDQ